MQHRISLAAVLLSLLIPSCSPSESAIATAMAKTEIASQSRQVSGQDICYWFFETQTLRTRRLSGLSEFTQWAQSHDLNALTTAEEVELVLLLDQYQPYQEEFVKDWKALGPHPDAMDFWEKELESVELRIQGVDEMNRGLENNDADLYQHGWDVFARSQAIGREGETAMLRVRSQCVN